MKQKYEDAKAYQTYRNMLEDLQNFPFTFTYNGITYNGFGEPALIPVSKIVTNQQGCESMKLEWQLEDVLQITLFCSFYASHGAMEWTVWFENISQKDSGIIENVKSSVLLEGGRPVLKGIYGDHEKNYEPYVFDLDQKNVHFESNSGRATHICFPYFNLEHGDGGSMLAIGWAGTWTADFEKTEGGVLYTARSVNNLKTYLKPGESIRTALFVVAPYMVRDENFATNYWRSWYMQHNLPKADAAGNDLQPFSTCCLASDTGLVNSDGSISEQYDTWKPSIDKMIEEDAKVDFRWFDAGWYVAPDGGSAEPYVKGRDWWDTVGTWELDPAKWPGQSFLESTEYARKLGMKTLVWFEPERVTYPDDLCRNYGYQKEWAIEQEGVAAISNNIGDPACRKWTTDRICKMLKENKVEMYREDNNCNPAQLWQFLDDKEGADRSGITECKFINGHYRMWDDFIACTLSYGGCGFVDSCASGGGRNDLESMRRGIPLLRSDADRTSTALRLSMTTAFNRWIPFCGANTKEKLTQLAATGRSDVYTWRASYLAALNVDSQFVQDPNQDFDMLRFGLKEWKRVSRYLLKDFYVLTPWHDQNDTAGFTAFAYVDPETEEGVLLAFRQEDCPDSELTLELPWLAAEALLINEDTQEQCTVTPGDRLNLTFDDPRTARLLWIRRKGA